MNPHSESAYFLNPLMRIFLQSLIEYVENLINVDLVPDFDRNGQIDSNDRNKVTEAEPFRWWRNDDDDTTEAAGGGDVPNSANQDHANFVVDGVRDLVDFFPLYLDLKDMLDGMPEDKFEYYLAHEDEAFRFFEVIDIDPSGDPEVDGPGAFIRNLSKAQSIGDSDVIRVTSEGARLSNELLAAIKNNEKGVVYLEGRAITTKPLQLKIKPISGGTRTTIAEFPVSISEVEDMFRYVNLRGLTGGDVGLKTSRKGEPANYPDKFTNGKYVVQVHGFNVDAPNGRGWSSEIFKRLHQLGSKTRFVGLAWYGNPGLDYHQAVFNAFKTSKSLASELSFANGDLTVMGHSLANMVISSAIEDYGFSPDRYYIINGAVAIEAYDDTQTGVPGVNSMFDNMKEGDWNGIGLNDPGYDKKFFASQWFNLFDASDNRNKLTWKKRFSSIIPIAYNFYSPGDEVVENSGGDETITDVIATQILSQLQGSGGFAKHTWVFQELAKGGKNSVSPLFFKKPQGGWNFHYNPPSLTNLPTEWEQGYWKRDSIILQTERRYTPEEAWNEITNEDLKEKPFFFPFENRDLFDPALGSTVAGEEETQWRLLGAAIPSESFAIAVNEVPKISQEAGEERNFNMMTMKENGQWPEIRLNAGVGGNWLHSDFRDVALSYVLPMYEKMIELGSFDQ
jgi:hypothetical protein